MDDLTWEHSLAERRKRIRRQRWMLGGILLLAVAFGVGVWYFLCYARTPEYTMKEVQAAIQSRDREKFARYVNLDLLTQKAYDDLTADLFAYDETLTSKTRSTYERFYRTVKPELTRGTAEIISRRIADGEWTSPQGADIIKGHQLGIDYERFLERTHLRTTKLVGVSHITRNGATATAELEVLEETTQTPFTLTAVLEEAPDGHFQVSYLKNYKDYLDAIAPRIAEDIESYTESTQDIVDKSNDTFLSEQAKFKLLSKTEDGHLGDSKRQELVQLIEQEIIPSLQSRQDQLDAIDVPAGATYLAEQRKLATRLTIESWQHYANALKAAPEAGAPEFEAAEALKKQSLAADARVDDIIHHTAVSKNIPNLP
jgi:hypothetical protein